MTYRTTLTTPLSRDRAKALIDRAPDGFVAEVREPKRTLAQNDMMWSLLGDIAVAKPMGREHVPEIWKCLFIDALGIKARWVPSLDGDGVVNTGHRSSRLSKQQMSDLIESIFAFGSEHGVVWTHEGTQNAA